MRKKKEKVPLSSSKMHLSMISGTFLIPDPKIPDFLLTEGSLGVHQLFLFFQTLPPLT